MKNVEKWLACYWTLIKKRRKSNDCKNKLEVTAALLLA